MQVVLIVSSSGQRLLQLLKDDDYEDDLILMTLIHIFVDDIHSHQGLGQSTHGEVVPDTSHCK